MVQTEEDQRQLGLGSIAACTLPEGVQPVSATTCEGCQVPHSCVLFMCQGSSKHSQVTGLMQP